VLWLGGLLAWAHSRGGLHNLAPITRWLDRQAVATQVVVVAAGLLSVAASSLIVDRLTAPL
jgi:hypothetical protein